MTGWAAFRAELDSWEAAGRCATFWWRDDDAADCSAALDRLFGLAADTQTAISLAVIPELATDKLARQTGDLPDIDILQHGVRHENHEVSGRKSELGDARPPGEVADQLAAARDVFLDLFPARLAVLVPPWNRISPAVTAYLPSLGFTGLSCFRARAAPFAADRVRAVNSHIDIVDWSGSRGFCGDEAALGAAISHLSARRTGTCDADEPTGLLTHHLAHDSECWQFIERMLQETSRHDAASWLSGAAVFEDA